MMARCTRPLRPDRCYGLDPADLDEARQRCEAQLGRRQGLRYNMRKVRRALDDGRPRSAKHVARVTGIRLCDVRAALTQLMLECQVARHGYRDDRGPHGGRHRARTYIITRGSP